jgi:hypothetical protein
MKKKYESAFSSQLKKRTRSNLSKTFNANFGEKIVERLVCNKDFIKIAEKILQIFRKKDTIVNKWLTERLQKHVRLLPQNEFKKRGQPA